ncbi:MAG: glutathione S-transferase N-terminal domain-containing protein [Pseudomonadota bacterium]
MNSHSLYYSNFCYFCHKVLRFLRGQDYAQAIELRSTSEGRNRADLIEGGGRGQVPCLRIETSDGEVQWMYESDDIIRYLDSALAGKAEGNPAAS